MATKQTIPAVGMDLDSHSRCLAAIKEAMEVGQSTPREFLDSFLTFRRAVDSGFYDTLQGFIVEKKARYADLLLNSPWIFFGGTATVPGFYRDALGRVFLRGLVYNGTSATAITTLPAGFRPEFTNIYSCLANVGAAEIAARVDVSPAGVVTTNTAGTFNYLSLDGISFAAFQ